MKKIIIKGSKGWKLVLKALKIKSDIPLNEIGGIYKGKVYRKGLLGAIQQYEDRLA